MTCEETSGSLIHGGSGAAACLPGPASETGPGVQGVPVLGAEDQLNHGHQRRELVAGTGWIARLPSRGSEDSAGVQRPAGARGRGPARHTGTSAASWSRAPAGSPARPVVTARLTRVVSVSGCSGPRTRSNTGTSAASWSRARPHPPPPRSSQRDLPRAFRVSGCSGPSTRSQTGTSAANWSRASAASPASPVQ